MYNVFLNVATVSVYTRAIADSEQQIRPVQKRFLPVIIVFDFGWSVNTF